MGSASVMRRLSLNRSEPAKKSGQNIPKNHCRTTIAERMVETLSGTALYRDQVGLFKAQPGRPKRTSLCCGGSTCPPSAAERHCSIADMTWS